MCSFKFREEMSEKHFVTTMTSEGHVTSSMTSPFDAIFLNSFSIAKVKGEGSV